VHNRVMKSSEERDVELVEVVEAVVVEASRDS
jgi:hypothetical protein